MIIHLTETESTNEYLKQLLRTNKVEEGSMVYADFQQAGKGQHGNSWESQRGENLLFSLVFYPDFVEINQSFILSKMISVAIIDTLKEEGIEDLFIKWPNDIYIEDKKIAGILIENSLKGAYIEHCIIGIGINLNQKEFHFAPNPVSLTQLTGKNYNPFDFLNKLKSNIFARYQSILEADEKSVNNDYFNHLYRNDGFYPYKAGNELFEAKIKTVLPGGQLVLETKAGKTKSFFFKEIEFI